MPIDLIRCASLGAAYISGAWLESLGFEEWRPEQWRLWIPDDEEPDVVSYLQLLPHETGHGPWIAELHNVVHGEVISVGIPRPMQTQSHVLLIITAVGGAVLP